MALPPLGGLGWAQYLPPTMSKAKLIEKVGYGFGDMASSMFWKIFSYYLPIFYSDIFGLSLGATATLMLVTRIWDTVSDPMMGVIADRTQTKWGKYRPYLLWCAAPFAISGILLFTTPDASETQKLVWAYVTYILMMTVYTGINVPYGSMLGVISNDSDEKTVFSSFRMFFAYAGSFIALFSWEPLCNFFESQGKSPQGAWQWAMICISAFSFLLFLMGWGPSPLPHHHGGEERRGSPPHQDAQRMAAPGPRRAGLCLGPALCIIYVYDSSR